MIKNRDYASLYPNILNPLSLVEKIVLNDIYEIGVNTFTVIVFQGKHIKYDLCKTFKSWKHANQYSGKMLEEIQEYQINILKGELNPYV